ncbi:hypothetical protein [Kitasatospora sp. NPDC093806]|uniref:hypothetical protein n=1 Tax=Kitasatospora sp. NPDC093806 TaxID=3155075 RepID=UPI0034213102
MSSTTPRTTGQGTLTRAGRRAIGAGALLAAAVLAGTTAAATTATAAPARPGSPWAATTRVSTGTAGAQPDGASWANGLSADGRYAVLGSDATNLVPGDTNGKTDVFVRDLLTGRTERVSLTSTGAQADGASYDGSISANGRYVVFTSTAALVPGDTNGTEDIYLRDRFTGRTERLTAGDPNSAQADRNSFMPSISWDGRYVAFASTRTDLVPGGSPSLANVYVTDRRTGDTRLITVGADGTPADRPSTAPVISGDGSTVGFTSKATNLLPATEGRPSGFAAGSVESGDSGDSVDDHVPGRPARAAIDSPSTGARAEILKPRHYPFYVHRLATGKTSGASIDQSGELLGSSAGSLSPDGRYAVFSLPLPNSPDSTGWQRHFEIFVRDLRQGTVRQLPPVLPGTATTGSSYGGVMAAGNRWVYFVSDAENLVPGDTNQVDDIFRHDLWTGRTERLSVSSDGAQTTGSSSGPIVDALGTTVLFTSDDGTLVPGDTNTASDAFTRRVSLF